MTGRARHCFRAIVLAVAALSAASPAHAQDVLPAVYFQGIKLGAIAPKPGAKFDVDIMAPGAALAKIRAALEILYRESPFSAAKIEKLKAAGQVIITYDPNYPDPRANMSAVRVAAFVHQADENDMAGGREKSFLAVVSRPGINWPVRELAAVLAHELVGHGTQHLDGRFKRTRNVDLECEAWLFEEKAYQDFRFDKSSKEMIQFRKELEGAGLVGGYCSDFKRYLRKHAPARLGLWESINPDVPKLLAAFGDYLRDLRDKGVTGAAIDAARKAAAGAVKRAAEEVETVRPAGK